MIACTWMSAFSITGAIDANADRFSRIVICVSGKVAIVGSAFEVTHEFSLERQHIIGNSGEISCLEQTGHRIGNRVYYWVCHG